MDEAGAAEAEGFELLRGAVFYRWRGLVAGLGTPHGVGVHTDETGTAEDDLDMTGSDGDVDFDRRG